MKSTAAYLETGQYLRVVDSIPTRSASEAKIAEFLARALALRVGIGFIITPRLNQQLARGALI